jgi:hypothetical protein
MRKYLATTAVVTMFACTAMASELSTKIGGNVDFEMGGVNQKKEYKVNLTPNQRNFMLSNSAHIFVSTEGKAENGMAYGANAKIMGTSQQNLGYANGKIGKTYLWIENQVGRVELGSNAEVSKLMAVGAESIAAATGGASDGSWVDYANFARANQDINPLEAMGNVFSNGDPLPSYSRYEKEADRKVSWMSPRYADFQLGISYSPDMANNADISNPDIKIDPYNQVKNAYSFAVNYSGTRNDMDISASITHDMGKTPATLNTHNVSASKVGLAIGKNGITAAGSYGTDGKSYMPRGTQGYTSKFYTAGIAYEDGPLYVSLTYLNRKTNSIISQAKLTTYGIGVDYKLAAGLNTYAEVVAFKAKDKERTTKNKGTVVMVGSSVSF